MTSNSSPDKIERKPLHDRIRRGMLCIVRTCGRCGEPFSANVTYEFDQCITCDVEDARRGNE